MASEITSRHDISRRNGARGVVVAVVVSALAAGCSYIPDAANPVEWYRSTSDYIFGDEAANNETAAQSQKPASQQSQVLRDRGAPPPGGDQPFPNLSTVPQRPVATSPQSRAEIADGLVADRDRARYSSDVIRRQGEPVSPLRRQQQTAATVSNAPPPPPAIPAAPVSRQAASPPVRSAQAPSRRLIAPPMPQASGNRAPASVEDVYRANLAQRFVPQLGAATGHPPSANSVAPTLDRFETVFVSSSGVQLGTDTRNAAVASRGRSAAPAAAGTARLPGMGTGQQGQNSIEAFLSRPGAAAGGGERVATIVFGVGSANLTARDRTILRDVAALHKERGGKIRINGHASHRTRTMDPVRHKLVNYRISLQRANVVTSELARLGVGRENVIVDARSDSQPIFYEVMPTGEAGNRRAEIYFVSN